MSRADNLIDSHVVYKLKVYEKGKRAQKARIFPHGNRDKLKDDVVKDSMTAQFYFIRLAVSMATGMNAVLGHVYIKCAYLHSGPIHMTIYVRPLRDFYIKRGSLWKLTNIPYGFTESGRQWALVFEDWLTSDGNLYNLSGVEQLFVRRDNNGSVTLFKVTDDLMMVGKLAVLEEFLDAVKKLFPVRKSVIDETIRFNGCLIRHEST